MCAIYCCYFLNTYICLRFSLWENIHKFFIVKCLFFTLYVSTYMSVSFEVQIFIFNRSLIAFFVFVIYFPLFLFKSLLLFKQVCYGYCCHLVTGNPWRTIFSFCFFPFLSIIYSMLMTKPVLFICMFHFSSFFILNLKKICLYIIYVFFPVDNFSRLYKN